MSENGIIIKIKLEKKKDAIAMADSFKYIKRTVIPPFLIELMGRKSKALLLFKNRWTTIY